MYILRTVSNRYFSGFMLGLPIWKDHPAQAALLSASEAGQMAKLLRLAGFDIRRESLTY